MPTSRQGSIRLFRFSGIDVFLHWSWFVVAAYEINGRTRSYSSLTWNVLEYLALFLIVMLHEFGHSLACRQVGGQANQIVLWPLGGVALCESATTPRRHTMEHRCWAAGERSARPNHHGHRAHEPPVGLVCGSPRPADFDSRYFLYRCRSADLQHSAYLSSRWRPDSSRLALVCARARA